MISNERQEKPIVSTDTPGPVVCVKDLTMYYQTNAFGPKSTGVVKAVDGVTLTIGHGECLGLVGESGSGKSTVGKCLVRLVDPTSGSIHLNGREIAQLPRRQLRSIRRSVHIVFQDPYSSLNPRMTIERIIGAPLRHHRLADGEVLRSRVRTMLERVDLPAEVARRYPHELSGGQRQRVAIARALIAEPALLVADEPLSALDASVQASMMNLLVDLQDSMGFGMLFITHDLSAARFMSHRIAVMYLGKIVETGTPDLLFGNPVHPYTRALLSAVPVPRPNGNGKRIILEGEIPSPTDPPTGCAFHTRCPLAIDVCRIEPPPSATNRDGSHMATCHLACGGESQLIGPDLEEE